MDALDARAADDRRPALRPPRHAVGHEDRPRGVRSRRVRRRHPEARSSRSSATLARPPHPADATRAGRWEIFHDVLAGAVLGWRAVTTPSGRSSGPAAEARRRHRRLAVLAFGALVGLALATRRWRSSRSRSGARHASRRGRRRAASSSRARCRCSTATPSSGSRSRSRRPASSRRARGGRAAAGARRLARARDHRHRPSARRLDVDRIRAAGARRRGRRRRADARPRTRGKLLWSHRVDGGGGGVRRRTAARWRRSSTGRSLTLDAATGKPRREARPGSAARSGRGARPEPRRRIGDRDRRQAPGARDLARDRGPDRAGQAAARVTDAAFSPDRTARRSRAAGTGPRRVWSTRTWREVEEPLRGHNGQVLSVAFDRTGDIVATGSTDQTAPRLARGARGDCSRRCSGTRAHLVDVAFGPGSVLVTASGDGTARTWRADGRRGACAPRPPRAGAEGRVRGRRQRRDWQARTARSGSGIPARASSSSGPGRAWPERPSTQGRLAGRLGDGGGRRGRRPIADARGREGARGAQGHRQFRRVQPRRSAAS